MDAAELHAILARGEDSRHQFKRDFSNVDSLAAELAALANGSGGQILIGVADDGQPWGLTPHDIGRINQLLSNAANQHLRPAHLPDTLTLTPAQIRAGQSNRRNKVLAEHATHILPYRGLGTGTPRALQAWSKIDLIDEREANQFSAILWRSSSEQVIANSSEQVSVRASEQVPAKGSEQAPESQPESQPESRTESRPESASLENRVLQTLASKPAIKLEIAAQLGQKAVSGQLNKVIRALLAAQAIKYILPDKPNSRLQKYRRTALKQALLAGQNNEERQP